MVECALGVGTEAEISMPSHFLVNVLLCEQKAQVATPNYFDWDISAAHYVKPFHSTSF